MNVADRRNVDQIISRLNLRPLWGIIGDSQGNMGTMSMLLRNMYYVRYPTSNGFSMPVPIRGPYDSPVTLQPGQCVKIGYDSENVPYIKSVDFGPTLSGGGNPVVVPPPAGGPVITQAQFATLKVFQDYNQPSLKVNINGWKSIVAGVLYDYPGTSQFDLSSFVPGSGHSVVGIFIKDDYLTPIAYASPSISLNDALGDADVNNVLSQAYTANPNYTPVWAYQVKTGATQILDTDTFLDMRQFIDASSQIQGGTVTGPASSTDTAVVRWSGTTGKVIQNSGVLIDAANNMTLPGNLSPTSDNARTIGSQALRFSKLYGVDSIVDALGLAVLNKSGAVAAVGDAGYLDYDATNGYEYKTTTTANLTGIKWCVVVDIGASGNDGTTIYVATQGKVTVTLNANCSIGNFLTTSTTAKQAAVNTLMRHEVFAICLTANAGGAGGTCVAQLLTGSQYYPASNTNDLWTVVNQSTTAWVGAISGTPTTTSVVTTTTSGSLNCVTQNAAGQLLNARLWNTTRNTYRLISSISGSTITTIASTDAWANGDILTIESQTTQSGVANKYVELDMIQSQPSPLSKLIRALAVLMYIRDSSTTASASASPSPFLAYSGSQTLGQNSIPVANTFNGLIPTIPIISGVFTLSVIATGTATAAVAMRLAGYVLATP